MPRFHLSRRLNRIAHTWRWLVTQSLLRPLFGAIGPRSVIFRPGLLRNTEYVRIGARSLIRYGCRIEVVLHGQAWMPSIEIGDDVNIEQNVHIVAHDRIRIGNRVSITGHCALVDVTHPAMALAEGRKIGAAIDPGRSSIEIGDDSFIGFGSTVLPNVRIGRGCVIGSRSVVTSDIPDGAIAAGVPARILGRVGQNVAEL